MEKFYILILLIFLHRAFSNPEVRKDIEVTKSERKTDTHYIFQGTEVTPREFPHLAAIGFLRRYRKHWLCGGTLISERFVLTAAHCVEDYNFRSYGKAALVRLGDLDLKDNSDDANVQEISVIQQIPHPNYTYPMKYNDIGLLRLKEAVYFNQFVKPACLHRTFDIMATQADVVGWGTTEKGSQASGQKLYKAEIDLQKIDKCADIVNGIDVLVRNMNLNKGLMEGSMICAGVLAGGRDICDGDSGGPLQVNSTQPSCSVEIIGIVSFALGMCAVPNTPAVYIRVSYYIPWIESVIKYFSN